MKKLMALAIALAFGLSMIGSVQAAHKTEKSTVKVQKHKGKKKKADESTPAPESK